MVANFKVNLQIVVWELRETGSHIPNKGGRVAPCTWSPVYLDTR